MKILLVYPNLPLMLVPPLAIALFTRILRRQGYEVDLFDTTSYVSDGPSSPQNRVKFLQARKFDEKKDLGTAIKFDLLKDFRAKVKTFKPDAIMYSVVEDAFVKATKMIDHIADLNIPHIVGGVFPTAAPEKCLEHPNINLIARGEGEQIVVDFAEAVRQQNPLNNIPGTWHKDESGEIHKNSNKPLIDLNEIIPDFDLFDEKRFYRPMGGRIFKTFPIETYRGCPYRCTFCNSPMQVSFAKTTGQGEFLRRKNLNVLKHELEEVSNRYNPEFFYFIDDSFLARPQKEIEAFCEMYRSFHLPFWFNTRPESCDTDTLKMLKDAGCYRISFGIECGNESYRKNVLKRNVTNEQIVKAFNRIAKSGIAFSINLIIGFPGETRDLIMDTVDLARSIFGYDAITVSMFTPYHGTELRAVAVKNGWLDADAITVHTTSTSMLDMPSPYISKQDLDGLMRVLLLYCYFPESEWEQIKRAEQDDEEGNRVLKHYSDIYTENFLKQTQDDRKIMLGGTGCKTNPKDAISLSQEEIQLLTSKCVFA